MSEKGERLNVRMEEDLKAGFQAAAKMRGLSLSGLISSFAVTVIDQAEKKDPKRFESLKARYLDAGKKIKAVEPQDESLNFSGKKRKPKADKRQQLLDEVKEGMKKHDELNKDE